MEKRKSKEERTGLTKEFSSGGVIFKHTKAPTQVLWLVTRSAPSKSYIKSVWRLPKGLLDDEGKKPGPLARGESRASEDDLQAAALREVKEEAGIKAKIVKKIGTERYFFTISSKRILKFVTFYLMEWLSDIPEGFGFETAEIAWLPFEKARKKLSFSGEKKVLHKAKEILDSGIQNVLI